MSALALCLALDWAHSPPSPRLWCAGDVFEPCAFTAGLPWPPGQCLGYLTAERRVPVPSWDNSWSCTLLRAPNLAGQGCGHSRHQGTVEVWGQWDTLGYCVLHWGGGIRTQLLPGIKVKLGLRASWECQACASCVGAIRVGGGLSSHTHLCHGGGSAQAFPAAVPAHPVPWMGQLLALQPESGQGGQTALAEGWGSGGAGEGQPCRWAGARWAGARVGWGRGSVQLLQCQVGCSQCLEALEG